MTLLTRRNDKSHQLQLATELRAKYLISAEDSNLLKAGTISPEFFDRLSDLESRKAEALDLALIHHQQAMSATPLLSNP
jgi:hypothetical protein